MSVHCFVTGVSLNHEPEKCFIASYKTEISSSTKRPKILFNFQSSEVDIR